MPALGKLLSQEGSRRQGEANGELAQGHEQPGDAHGDCPDGLHYRNVDVMIALSDEREDRDGDRQLRENRQDSGVLHPFEALKQPDRE